MTLGSGSHELVCALSLLRKKLGKAACSVVSTPTPILDSVLPHIYLRDTEVCPYSSKSWEDDGYEAEISYTRGPHVCYR